MRKIKLITVSFLGYIFNDFILLYLLLIDCLRVLTSTQYCYIFTKLFIH